MDNKGFTLVELIVTLVLMTLVGLVIAANMTGMFSKEEDNSINSFKKKLEDAACVLVESNDYRGQDKISVSELIENGLVDKDMKDPRTGEKVNKDSSVSVSYNSDNVKSCVFNE